MNTLQGDVFKAEVEKELSSLPKRYKDEFIKNGILLPLKTVPFYKSGSLERLSPSKQKKGWPWDKQVDPIVYETKEWPKLSIVIPSYNQGQFLEEAIRSVLLQNYPNLELIVMDGGSTDASKAILDNYAPWLSYWHSKRDKGQGNAINMGFSIASGDYIGWLNSDDLYNESALVKLANEIKQSGKDFYYGDGFNVNVDNTVRNYWKAFWVNDNFLRYGGLIASHSAFWKRSVNQPIWEQMNCNVDGELWIRLLKGRSKKHIRFPLGSIRQYETTKTAGDKWKDKWKEDDDNIDRIHGRPPGPRDIKSYLFRFIQKLYKDYFNKSGKLERS